MTIKSVLGPVAVKGCVYLLFQLENLCSLTFCAFSTPAVELVSLALHGIPQRPELTGQTRPDYCCNVILVIIVIIFIIVVVVVAIIFIIMLVIIVIIFIIIVVIIVIIFIIIVVVVAIRININKIPRATSLPSSQVRCWLVRM